jgi:hypothetical protein
MKRFCTLCLVVGAATVLSLSQTLAQSGVVSGPPQARQGPGPNPVVSPPSPPAMETMWIAVAAGFDGAGRKVSVGYSGHQRTRAEAENEALRLCNNVDRGVSCREPFSVTNGCLYIVPGEKRGGVRWGRGETADIAVANCRKGGFSCPNAKVIGGCLPGYQ